MNTDIHRLLDDVFTGIEMTPDIQDLKEEVRANLIARVAELETSGVAPAEAARLAIVELGDIRELIGDTDDEPHRVSGIHDDYARHHVRPKTGFVVRIVVWSIAVIAGVGVGGFAATGHLPLPIGSTIALLGIAAAGLGLIVGDSLSQETTTNHPMPLLRATGYALATFLAAYGLGFVALIALQALPVWGIVIATLGLVAAIVLFTFLGASQTNRHKSWVRQAHARMPPNRFETEPATAARFGIYTVAIWAVTFAVMVVLIVTVGWWWAPVAIVGGFVTMMLLLARMMWSPRKDA